MCASRGAVSRGMIIFPATESVPGMTQTNLSFTPQFFAASCLNVIVFSNPRGVDTKLAFNCRNRVPVNIINV